MRCRYPRFLKVVRFVGNSLSFNRLNISCADIPYVLENSVGEAVRSTRPVTLYITVDITYNGLPIIPTRDDDSLAEEVTVPGRIQLPTPEHPLPLSHRQPLEANKIITQGREEMSPTTTKNPQFSLRLADEAMMQVVPIDGSNSWERAVGRIKWLMDTLGPIAEVRV
jgi:hypothetical protein